MPIKSLIKETLFLQGFRIDSIDRFSFGLNIKIIPDRRYRPRCGRCGHTGKYRDTRPERQFKHVPLWGLPVFLSYSPRRVVCKHCGGIYVEQRSPGLQESVGLQMLLPAIWPLGPDFCLG